MRKMLKPYTDNFLKNKVYVLLGCLNSLKYQVIMIGMYNCSLCLILMPSVDINIYISTVKMLPIYSLKQSYYIVI